MAKKSGLCQVLVTLINGSQEKVGSRLSRTAAEALALEVSAREDVKWVFIKQGGVYYPCK